MVLFLRKWKEKYLSISLATFLNEVNKLKNILDNQNGQIYKSFRLLDVRISDFWLKYIVYVLIKFYLFHLKKNLVQL